MKTLQAVKERGLRLTFLPYRFSLLLVNAKVVVGILRHQVDNQLSHVPISRLYHFMVVGGLLLQVAGFLRKVVSRAKIAGAHLPAHAHWRLLLPHLYLVQKFTELVNVVFAFMSDNGLLPLYLIFFLEEQVSLEIVGERFV